MIRVFELFCKLNVINLSAEDLFLQSMAKVHLHDHKCPFCSAEHPDWKKHAVYERYLISFESGRNISYLITIVRYKCSSCGHTHAILPEFVIPYQSYSLLFILSVMRNYYIGSLTVADICEKYDIAVSTLYSWKELFLRHKKVWLGLLDDACTSSLQFLDCLFINHLRTLKEFFIMAGVSFLQGPSHIKKAYFAPT